MKNSTIQLLHKGKKRKVQKQEYSKLRTYNKIKTSRVSANPLSSSSARNTAQQNQITYEQVVDVIEGLKKDIQGLTEEIREINKQLKINEKIQRIINKKYPQIAKLDDQNVEANRQINLKQIQTMLQIKLSLDVIQLETVLEQKNQHYKELSNPKRRNIEEQIRKELTESKVNFLKLIFNDQNKILSEIQNLRSQKIKQKQTVIVLHNRIKNCQKTKTNQLRILQQLQYELKQARQDSQLRKKKMRKDSCQYIEVQNGQIRNQQDIKNEIKNIKDRRMIEGEQLQNFLEEKMREKIVPINQIDRYERDCKELRNKIDIQKFGNIRDSIQAQ